MPFVAGAAALVTQPTGFSIPVNRLGHLNGVAVARRGLEVGVAFVAVLGFELGSVLCREESCFSCCSAARAWCSASLNAFAEGSTFFLP